MRRLFATLEETMKELLKNKKLILQHVPGKGAWTYHLIIPGTKDIRGRWGSMKVSGTIDDYEFEDLNLAPVSGEDKRISVNGDIRKAIGKGGGDEVLVTMYKTSDNRLTEVTDIIDCFRDADVYKNFVSLPKDEQENLVNDILSQQDEFSQEKKIIAIINKW